MTPETERLLVAPLKVVMDHISEAFHQPRKLRSGGTGRLTERMVWGKEGLGSWVALLAEQVTVYVNERRCGKVETEEWDINDIHDAVKTPVRRQTFEVSPAHEPISRASWCPVLLLAPSPYPKVLRPEK